MTRPFAPSEASDAIHGQSLDVFVMEVDMAAAGKAGCTSCNATLARVRETAELLRPVFRSLGLELNIAELRVGDLTQARALGLQASPMIRIGGFDLYPEHHGQTADGAGGLETDRVWRWNGQTYDQPPAAMLIDAFLRAYAQNRQVSPAAHAEVPRYVRQFLGGEPLAEAASTCSCG